MIADEELSQSIQDLSSADSSERRAAAEALSNGDERAIYPLLRTLRDENTGVQDAAIRSLIAIGGEVTAYMVLPLLRESPFLRNTARMLLKQIGKTSVPLLRALLADKDDDIRTFAVDLIADIGWCDYPRELARLLETDQNQNVRAAAAKALGIIGYREALPILVAALRSDEWVCFSALDSLSAFGDESCIEPVGALLGSPSEALRFAAIETLGRIGSSKSSAQLLAYLPRAGAIEKTAIVKSLVQIGITPSMAEVADLLIDIFKSGEWEDRQVALRGLADLRDRRAIPAMIDVAGSLDPSDPDSEERLYAVKDALRQFGCARGLIEAISSPVARFRGKVIAIEVIGDLACPEAVPHLIKLMEGDLREVRRASVKALAGMRENTATKTLRESINDRDGHVRNAAITALGRIGDRASFNHLLEHLAVENYQDVLEETVKALLLIDTKELCAHLAKLSAAVKELIGRYAVDEDLLLSLSGEGDAAVRVSALTSLGRIQGKRALRRLVEALKDREPEARKAAVRAMGGMNCCYEEIQSALNDSNIWVRVAAIKALGDSGRPDFLDALSSLLKDKDAPIVLAAIDAVASLAGAQAPALLGMLKDHADEAVKERVTRLLEGAW